MDNFLLDVHDSQRINFRCIRHTDGHVVTLTSDTYDEAIQAKLAQLNTQDYEIYHVVNSGGYRDEQIDHINAVFIDLDCGRDSNKDYWPVDIADTYKQLKLSQLARFQLQPSYIIETRNGLHVYWLVDDTVTTEHFGPIVSHLSQVFDADKSATNLARLMRVPGYTWNKGDENFTIRVVQSSNVRYSLDRIISIIPFTVEDSNRYNTSISIIHPKTSNIDLIRQQDHQTLGKLLAYDGMEFNRHDDVTDYLKRQDLWRFLGISDKRFTCIVHPDTKPSATIFVDRDSGYHFYKCFSDTCGFTGTIIQVVERIAHVGRYTALKFLRKVYNVSYVETDWQREQKERLKSNKDYVMKGEMEHASPELYKRIKQYIPELLVLHDLAIDHVLTENFTDTDGLPLFYASTSYISQLLGKSNGKTSDRLALFVFLGLLNKLSAEEIPEFLYQTAKFEAARKRQPSIVNYMSIPEYSQDLFQSGRDKAIELEQRGVRMTGFSRETLLRTFGEEVADKVYPQMKGRKIRKLNEDITRMFERITNEMIADKGWAREGEILMQIRDHFITSKSYNERQLKRVIPELLDKYGLERVRLNTELKRQMNIDMAGFPYIIRKKEV